MRWGSRCMRRIIFYLKCFLNVNSEQWTHKIAPQHIFSRFYSFQRIRPNPSAGYVDADIIKISQTTNIWYTIRDTFPPTFLFPQIFAIYYYLNFQFMERRIDLSILEIFNSFTTYSVTRWICTERLAGCSMNILVKSSDCRALWLISIRKSMYE